MGFASSSGSLRICTGTIFGPRFHQFLREANPFRLAVPDEANPFRHTSIHNGEPEGAATALGGAVSPTEYPSLSLTTAVAASESILWFMDKLCIVKGGAYLISLVEMAVMFTLFHSQLGRKWHVRADLQKRISVSKLAFCRRSQLDQKNT
jgi:hypothetical protein